jgi:hypothetical protein
MMAALAIGFSARWFAVADAGFRVLLWRIGRAPMTGFGVR